MTMNEDYVAPWPDGPLDADPQTLRGGPGYAELLAAHRRLNDRLAGASLPVERQREVTARLDELTELLAGYAAGTEHERVDGLRPDLPGRGHPLLPPFVVDEATSGAGAGAMHGRVTFTRFHLGGGAAVHGGVQPLLFDDILGRVANHDMPGVARTAYLTVDYRQVTPLDVELHWDVSLDRVEGRKRFATGRLTAADGAVLAEARALFVELLPGQP